MTITWDAGALPEAEFMEVCARLCEEVQPYTDASRPGRVVTDEAFASGDYLRVQLHIDPVEGRSFSLFSEDLERPRDGCGCRHMRVHVNDASDGLIRD